MSAINSLPLYSRLGDIIPFPASPNCNQSRSVSSSRVKVGAGRVHVHLLVPSTGWSHQGRTIIAPKSTRVFVL